MRFCTFVLVAGLLKTAFWPAVADAELSLAFDQSGYSVPTSGQTVLVSVLVVQTPGGPQVGPGNGLLSAAIDLTFNTPGGIAAVNSVADITGNLVFSSISTDLQPVGAPSTAILGELSVAGNITDLSAPLLLGTFKFTGLADGATVIHVSSRGPGASFVTAQNNIVDPTNIPAATIVVGVPEPSGIVLASCALGGVVGLQRYYRRARRNSNAA